MRSVHEAEQLILRHVIPFSRAEVPLEKAYGCVLQEEVIADRDQPPHNRSTMDGIVIRSSIYSAGRRTFAVEGIIKAGDPPVSLTNPEQCFEIMTGALIPDGCDCVVPVEKVQMVDGEAWLEEETLAPMQNIHAKAADYTKGQVLLKPGTRLTPQRIAIAAAVGKSKIKISVPPSVALIGTGDELVEIDQPVKPFQVRRSNVYTLEAVLHQRGYTSTQRFHIRDDERTLYDSLLSILKKFDILILSGGVSMGKYDFVPAVLEKLGIEVVFHKVKQKPGKPFWFGKQKTGKVVFALPGNPVSTQVCTYRYVLPYLTAAAGAKADPPLFAVLAKDMSVKGELTSFIPVRISPMPDGSLSAAPVTYAGSGDYASLAATDGFIQCDPKPEIYPKGSAVPVFVW